MSTNLSEEELKSFIWSKDVRDYIVEIGWKFTDLQKVVLIVQYSDLSEEEKLNRLHSIMINTSSDKLKKELKWYIDRKNAEMNLFKRNPDQKCAYTLYRYIYYKRDNKKEYEEYGTFFDYEIALDHGLDHLKEYDDNIGFRIRKNRIITKKISDYAKKNDSIDTLMEFNEKGECIYFFSNEIPYTKEDKKIMKDYHAPFDTFVEIPNPFEKGDIVKAVDGEKRGIIDTSQKEWKKYLNRIYSGEMTADYVGGDSIITIFPKEVDEEHPDYDHCSVMYWERYYPDKKNMDKTDKLLLKVSKRFKKELRKQK